MNVDQKRMLKIRRETKTLQESINRLMKEKKAEDAKNKPDEENKEKRDPSSPQKTEPVVVKTRKRVPTILYKKKVKENNAYPEKFEQCWKNFKSFMNSNKWQNVSKKDNEVIDKLPRTDNKSLYLYRVVRTFEGTIPVILELLSNPDKHTAWDPAVEKISDIKT
eukprot:UN27699